MYFKPMVSGILKMHKDFSEVSLQKLVFLLVILNYMQVQHFWDLMLASDLYYLNQQL